MEAINNNYIGDRFLVSRTVAMPENLNFSGGVFGGWIFSLMDIASIIAAKRVCDLRFVTRAVADLTFEKPMFVGDEIAVFACINRVGNTSIKVEIEVCPMREKAYQKAASGCFTLVAVDDKYSPVSIFGDSLAVNFGIKP